MTDRDIKFPQWEGYENLDGMKQLISLGCYDDPKLILEYAAKMSMERQYFKDMLVFVQNRIQRYFEDGGGLGLGIDSSKEIFEGLAIVPAEDVSFPEEIEEEGEEEENEGDEENDSYERFIEDMKRAGIEYEEEYYGRFFYDGPAVRTNEQGFPTLQDVIRATKIELQWDNLGHDFIIYPYDRKS